MIGILEQFANSNPQIEALFKGYNPDCPRQTVYYFLNKNYRYDMDFEDTIMNLELKLSKKTKESFMIMCWPISTENAGNYPFLGKCIYKKYQQNSNKSTE